MRNGTRSLWPPAAEPCRSHCAEPWRGLLDTKRTARRATATAPLLWPWVGFEVKPMSEVETAGQLITGIQHVWAEARAIAREPSPCCS